MTKPWKEMSDEEKLECFKRVRNDMENQRMHFHPDSDEGKIDNGYIEFWDEIAKDILQHSTNSIVNDDLAGPEFNLCRGFILGAVEYLETARRSREINHF